MIFTFVAAIDKPFNGFYPIFDETQTLEEKLQSPVTQLNDPNKYLEVINSENPYRGISLKEDWKPLKVELDSTAKSRKVGDISELATARSPVFSEKAMNVLGDLLENNGEFLELDCISNGKKYYVYNVLTYADIIDDEKTKRHLYFKENVDFDKLSIFKIISHKDYIRKAGNIYLTQKFMERVVKYKLKGLYFYKIGFIPESVPNKDQLKKFYEFNENLPEWVKNRFIIESNK